MKKFKLEIEFNALSMEDARNKAIAWVDHSNAIQLTEIKERINFTRINSDVNGNPRYVCHYMDLLTEEELEAIRNNKTYDVAKRLNADYELAVKKSRPLGGRKYNTKSYGGGIVFQSYNIQELEEQILNLTKEK